jgi:hypothetical protein
MTRPNEKNSSSNYNQNQLSIIGDLKSYWVNEVWLLDFHKWANLLRYYDKVILMSQLKSINNS